MERLRVGLNDGESPREIPAPRPGVAAWPVVGKKIYGVWSKAHADLPALVQSMQPKIGDLAKPRWGWWPASAAGLLQFLASFIIAGIIMAFGEAGSRSSRAIFEPHRGHRPRQRSSQACPRRPFARSRRVYSGWPSSRPSSSAWPCWSRGFRWRACSRWSCWCWASPRRRRSRHLARHRLIWISGDYGTGAAIAVRVLLFLAGMLDNVLKPLLLGRGVEAPMPVILLGALGGMATAGILGMFVGAILLALGYQIFMRWVAANPDAGEGRRRTASRRRRLKAAL